MIPIDQAEELFAAENTEAARALELLVTAVLADKNAFIITTIRSDAFARMQETPALVDVAMLPFSLAAMPPGAFKDAIEGPARVANPPLSVDPALTEQLLKDLATDDALPLLAFTLERLLLRSGGKRMLTLADYDQEMGGLQGAILAALEEAFAKAQRDPALPPDRVRLEALAKLAFIPGLVQVDEADAEPKRRTERLDALPEATHALIRYLIDARLLVGDRGIIDSVAADTVEVAHEAILRQWPALRSWIAEEREALLTLDGVRAAAKLWRKHAVAGDVDEQAWLTHGRGRLDEAERLLATAHFANALGTSEREYLAACRARDDAERERERNEIEREKQHIADTQRLQRENFVLIDGENKAIIRTRRLQRNIFVLIGVAAAILIVAALGIAELLKGIAIRSSDALAKLSEQAADNQDYEQAGRYALAGLAGADWPIVGYSGARAVQALVAADLLSRRIAILGGHNGFILSAALSPDGRRIVTAFRDKTARVWDVATGAQLTVLRGHDGPVTSAAYSPDGKRIVTASLDKTARIWDARTGKHLAILVGHTHAIRSAMYSPDGTRIVTASDDKTARIWDAATGTQLTVLHGHDSRVFSAAYSPDGSRIVTGSNDKTARIWGAATGTQLTVLRGHDDAVATAAFSPDGRRIVTASWDKTARIWDATTGTQLSVLRGHDDAVETAAYSPDGRRIVTASDDKTARSWDAETGTQLGVLRGHDAAVEIAAYSPDGRRIVTASDDMRIWDAATGTPLAVLRGHDNAVLRAAYSPDDRRIVTTSNDKTARIWDAATGTQLGVLRGHDDAVESAAYSPDGTRMVTASDDKTARIWDARTGAQIAVLRGHDGPVYSAAYNPLGTRIVTASDDKTARIWDAATGTQLTVLRGHGAARTR